MDPTPTEAEMREAEEYARTAKTENEYGPHTRHDVVLAYAAALAKCRVERERLVAALEKYGKHSRECREDQAASGMLGLDVKCLCGLAAAIRGGGQ